jgi:ATP-dependent Clp protease protease subunit
MTPPDWPPTVPQVPPEVPPLHPAPMPPPPPPAPPWIPTVPVDPVERSVAERLLARRVLLVTGHLDADAATRAAASIMLLDAESDRPLELHLSTPSAELDAAVALAETVALTRGQVTALARGSVGGCAVAVLAAAGRRLASPHALITLTEPRTSFEGSAADLGRTVDSYQRQLDVVVGYVAQVSGRDRAEVAADFRRGLVLTAQEAVGYGLLTGVLG